MNAHRAEGEATLLLERIRAGDRAAVEELLPSVYDQLRALADGYFRRQRPDHTLEPTALVHEAYLKIAGASGGSINDRAHFCAVAATAMRQILINHAEAKRAAKRGGDAKRVPLTEIRSPSGGSALDVEALHDAMLALEEIDARKARIVELWFFGGMTVEEIAVVLDISVSTVGRQWRSARAWLSDALCDGEPA